MDGEGGIVPRESLEKFSAMFFLPSHFSHPQLLCSCTQVPAGLRDTMNHSTQVGREQLPGLASLLGGFHWPSTTTVMHSPGIMSTQFPDQVAYLRSLQDRISLIVAASTTQDSVYRQIAVATQDVNYCGLAAHQLFDDSHVLQHSMPDSTCSMSSIASLLSSMRHESHTPQAAALLLLEAAAQAQRSAFGTTNSPPPFVAQGSAFTSIKCSHRADSSTDGKETPSTKQAVDEGTSDDSAATAATCANSRAPGPARAPRKQPTGRRSQWSAEEHQRFLSGLERFGPKDSGAAEPGTRISVGLGPGVAEVIAVVVGTRTVSQVRSHAQKFFLRQTRKTVN